MKLKRVDISGFRSIESASLEDCGEFNVIIGKNNVGKSNILSAIASFFDGIRDGRVVSDDQSIGLETDFFDKDVNEPIQIVMTFGLELAERDILIRDIASDAPQLRNTLDGISPSLDLSANWTVKSTPSRFGYVKQMVIQPARNTDHSSEQLIFGVSDEAAIELLERTSRSRRVTADLAGFDSIARELPDIWRRYGREPRSEQIPFRFLFDSTVRSERGRFSRSPETIEALERIVYESTSLEELSGSIESYKQRLLEEAESLRNERISNNLKTFAGEQSIVPQYVRSLLKRMSEIRLLHLRERRNTIGVEEAQKILDLKVRRGGEQRLNSIRDTVSSLLGVKLDAFGESSGDGRQSIAELDIDDFLVQVNGAGIREALRIVLDYEFQQPQIVLIEEPEIHLHPALETGMMRYLKRISLASQVFITTHSTNFLDTGEMKNVYLVSKNESTSIRLMDIDAAESQIPRELGLRLSSLFMYDRLVFVEGPTDESILREFALTLQINLGQANVGFVPMGGARKFAYYAAESSLSFLSKRQVRTWFLLDQDEGKDQGLIQFFEQIGSTASVTVLQRREIENYLLNPKAISLFINSKKSLANQGAQGDSPPPSEVQASLQAQADQLKELAVGKRVASLLCKPIYSGLKGALEAKRGAEATEMITSDLQQMRQQVDNRISHVDAVFRKESDAISADWDQIKLHVVQGDLLLDSVCQEFGVRYKKDLDGPRLASLIDGEEVSDEIREFLQNLAS